MLFTKKPSTPNKYFAFADEQAKIDAEFEEDLRDPQKRAELARQGVEALRRRAQSSPIDYGLKRLALLFEHLHR